MIIHFRLFVFLYAVVISSLQAETVKEVAERAHIASINALLIFTSQNGLSTGRYDFTNVGARMEVYKLPFRYHFESKKDAIDYFVVGNVGYSRVFLSEDIDIPPNGRLSYENHIRTYTAGLGGGARYKATKDLHFSGGIELIYSRSGVSVETPDDDIGDAIEDFFNQDYTNNITYAFFAIAEYRLVINEFKPYAELGYSVYETSSKFSFEEILTFESQSSVSTLAIGVETPALFESNSNHLTLEAYVNGNYLTGAVVESVQFDTYYTLGLVAYWYTPVDFSWAKRFFFEISSIQSDGLDGYNIGAGFTVDF